MSVIIENLTDKPLWLRLNSGATVSVMPHASSQGVAESEVGGNPKLQRLTEQRVIRVQMAGEETEGEPAPREGRRTGATRRNP
jgi:hypothetical protein